MEIWGNEAMAQPYEDRCYGAVVVESVTVKAGKKLPTAVTLSAIDSILSISDLAWAAILVWAPSQGAVDFAHLKDAVRQLAVQLPVLAGRVNTDAPQLEVVNNDAGIPLTHVSWPEGRSEDIRPAKGFVNWEARLPVEDPDPPIFVDPMTPRRVMWEGEAPLKLRLTSLGDGGSVLSVACWHGFLDGHRLMRVLSYLATLYRGEVLSEVPTDRSLLSAEGLAQLLPNGEVIVGDAIKLHRGGEEDRELNFGEAHRRINKDLSVPLLHQSLDGNKRHCSWARAILHLPRTDLEALRVQVQQTIQEPEVRVSMNDILTGFLWCLRRTHAGRPLPGQEQKQEWVRDLTVTVVDLDYNVLPPGSLDNYVGNAFTGLPVDLPPAEDGSGADSALGLTMGSTEAWTRAVATTAVAVRNAMAALRAGGGLSRLIETVVQPKKIQKEHDFCVNTRMGRSNPPIFVRCLSSNWLRFATNKVNFGFGPPAELLPYFHRVSDLLTVFATAPGNDGVYVHLDLPSEALDNTSFLQILPNARFLRG